MITSKLPFWSFYILLEADLEETFRFVDPVEAQLEVYSEKFARIILLACVEIENALIALSDQIDPGSSPRSLSSHCNVVHSKYVEFNETVITAPRYNLLFRPWEDWSNANSPDWWKLGYNKIKHDRLRHPEAATMRRALESVSALLVVLLHYYRVHEEIHGIPEQEKPKLLLPMREHEAFLGQFDLWTWPLPDDDRALRELNKKLEITRAKLDGK